MIVIGIRFVETCSFYYYKKEPILSQTMEFNPSRDNPGIFLGGYNGATVETKYGKIEHQCNFNTLTKFREILEPMETGVFVEIGVLGGVTLLCLYDLCKERHIKMYGIDPFETIEVYNGLEKTEVNDDRIPLNVHIKQLNNRLNLEKIIEEHSLDIELIVGTSWENQGLFEDESIDVLHIDGDHSYNGVSKDIELFWPKVKRGGIVLFDDYDWGSVSKAVNQFITSHGIEKTHYYPFYEKLVVTKSSSSS